MAERRMFAKTIIDSDAFIDMPVTARLLYYDLAMRADDDGFVNSPKKIMRMIGASQDDLSILIMRKFILPFDNGVVVIKHWRIHNYIRKDTYCSTPYIDEKSMLELDENKAYKFKVNESSTDCQRIVDVASTQVRLVKDSIDKDSIDKTNKAAKRFSDDDALNEAIKDFVDHRKKLRKPMTDRAIELFIKRLETLCPDNSSGQVELIQTAIERGWQTVYPSKETHAEPKKTNSKLQELEALYLEE